MRSTLIAIVVGATTLAGCQPEVHQATAGQVDTRRVANLVARVGGVSIGAAEVEGLMQVEDLSAEAALQQLIDEELLAQEAARLGFSVEPEAERGIERMMVRAMLHDMEKEHTPELVSDEELREDYARFEDRFRVPERRRSWHILVKDSGEEAQAIAGSILRELHRADDPRTVFERYAQGAAEGTELEVLAEDLPAVTEKASLQKSYRNAIFAAKTEGPLKDLVQTSYGWHAIVVAEILPAEQRSMAEVEDETRVRISQAKRAATLVQTVQSLKAEGLVSYDERGVERLLSMERLPERAN